MVAAATARSSSQALLFLRRPPSSPSLLSSHISSLTSANGHDAPAATRTPKQPTTIPTAWHARLSRSSPSIPIIVGEERGGDARRTPRHHRHHLHLWWAQIQEEEEESAYLVSASVAGRDRGRSCRRGLSAGEQKSSVGQE